MYYNPSFPYGKQTYPIMQQNHSSSDTIQLTDWYSEEFIHESVVKYLKENGYKIQRDNSKEQDKPERSIVALKFFKKEIIEVKGFPRLYNHSHEIVANKNSNAKSWFVEAFFNSLLNFSMVDNAELAMAVPNVSRYQAIIAKLNDYFTINDLYFRLYLVNEDGSVEVSNLNDKFAKMAS